MSLKVNLIFYDFGSSNALVNELIRFYNGSKKFDIEQLSQAAEVNQYIPAVGNGILFFKVQNKVDLQNAVGILKTQKNLIKKGLLKPACITAIKNKKVEQVLAKYGCVDLLEPDTKAKTLSFKLDFWSKPILAHLEKVSREEELKVKKKEIEEAKKPKELLNKVPALDLASDFWILKSDTDCKKVLKRYLVRLVGPSSFIGSWVELKARPGDKQPTWKWVLKDTENTDFIKDEGTWYFYGAKPEFDWKLKKWSFSSELPHLYFYTKDQKVFSRFKIESNVIDFAKNSEFALTREELIAETCDTKYNFEGEESKTESDDVEGCEGESLGKNLAGKSSTDNIDASPLSGAVNPREELNPEEKKKKFAEDENASGPLAGKSSTDNIDASPLSGAVNPGEELNPEEKKKKFAEEENASGPLAGKSSTDNIDASPLSGAVNPGDELNPEEKKKKFAEDENASGPLAGKSSTDNIDASPLSGAVNPGEELNPEEKKKKKKEAPRYYRDDEFDENSVFDDLSEYQVMEGFLDSINKKRKEEGKPEISDIDEMSPSERREAQVFSQKRKSNRDLKREHKEEELLEALGGGLTDSAPFEEETTQKLNLVELQRDTIIDNKNTVPEKEKLDLDEVIGSGPEVDTESGELKVVLKQKQKLVMTLHFYVNLRISMKMNSSFLLLKIH